jgi:hypothetical protein
MEPNVFLGYFTRGITGVLSRFGHEQYPSNSIDQNKLTYGVYLWNILMRVLVFL